MYVSRCKICCEKRIFRDLERLLCMCPCAIPKYICIRAINSMKARMKTVCVRWVVPRRVECVVRCCEYRSARKNLIKQVHKIFTRSNDITPLTLQIKDETRSPFVLFEFHDNIII